MELSEPRRVTEWRSIYRSNHRSIDIILLLLLLYRKFVATNLSSHSWCSVVFRCTGMTCTGRRPPHTTSVPRQATWRTQTRRIHTSPTWRVMIVCITTRPAHNAGSNVYCRCPGTLKTSEIPLYLARAVTLPSLAYSCIPVQLCSYSPQDVRGDNLTLKQNP